VESKKRKLFKTGKYTKVTSGDMFREKEKYRKDESTDPKNG
jgi:hypothetical protein